MEIAELEGRNRTRMNRLQEIVAMIKKNQKMPRHDVMIRIMRWYYSQVTAERWIEELIMIGRIKQEGIDLVYNELAEDDHVN